METIEPSRLFNHLKFAYLLLHGMQVRQTDQLTFFVYTRCVFLVVFFVSCRKFEDSNDRANIWFVRSFHHRFLSIFLLPLKTNCAPKTYTLYANSKNMWVKALFPRNCMYCNDLVHILCGCCCYCCCLNISKFAWAFIVVFVYGKCSLPASSLNWFISFCTTSIVLKIFKWNANVSNYPSIRGKCR